MDCIIVNNDQKQIEEIRSFVARTSLLSLDRTFTDPTEALSLIHLNSIKPDLVFFDLSMIRNGDKDFFKLLGTKTLFIFSSCDPAQAVVSYELDAVDFLLSPLSYDRFLRSIHKAEEMVRLKKESKKVVPMPHRDKEEFIFLKSGNQIHKINIDDILYLEKDSNYFVVHFRDNKKLLIRINFSELLSMLPESKFMRVHKSYVIGFKHIDYIEGNNIVVNKEHIPIAITYKNEFMRVINA